MVIYACNLNSRRLRQEDFKLRANLGCIVSLGLLQWETKFGVLTLGRLSQVRNIASLRSTWGYSVNSRPVCAHSESV